MAAGQLSAQERDRLALAFAGIASEAGVAVMEVYASDFETRHKSDRSPVSDADERAEEIILAHLARLLPGVPVLAEEQAARIGVGEMADTFILVDPVDGTREFIQRKGDFTVNIALIEGGVATSGCVFAPARRDLYYGASRAFSASGFEAGRAVEAGTASPVTTRIVPPEGMIAVMSASHLDAETQAFIDRQKIASRRSIGSSLKFCLVAVGEADVYPRWGPTMEWDTAAGHAVLSAAGGVVLTPEGAPFLYGKADKGYLNGPFIAWGKAPV